MNDPEVTLKAIPEELDASGWHLEFDATDIRVYSKFGASGAPVIGFRTVTEHPVAAITAYNLLKDVCKAMELVNHQYTHGETFKPWPTESAPDGTLVRTSFNMPFPFKNREFLHGLHATQLNEHTYLVGYTPETGDDIPIQEGYVRCPMYISGQRITQLNTGHCRVEHLMVYHLSGKVSYKVQDRFLKKGHVGAYKKEWRNLRKVLFPVKAFDANHTLLTRINLSAVEASDGWKANATGNYGKVASGRVGYCPRTVYRLESKTHLPIKTVTEVLGLKSLEYLPKWNKEFLQGELLETLQDTEAVKAWIVKVQYKTPAILNHREYVYYFSVEQLSPDEVMINYQSVVSGVPIQKGFTRATLFPSCHYLKRTNNGTRIIHLLATDLGGKLGKYQDKLLENGLIKAQIRDMKSQAKLFADLA